MRSRNLIPYAELNRAYGQADSGTKQLVDHAIDALALRLITPEAFQARVQRLLHVKGA